MEIRRSAVFRSYKGKGDEQVIFFMRGIQYNPKGAATFWTDKIMHNKRSINDLGLITSSGLGRQRRRIWSRYDGIDPLPMERNPLPLSSNDASISRLGGIIPPLSRYCTLFVEVRVVPDNFSGNNALRGPQVTTEAMLLQKSNKYTKWFWYGWWRSGRCTWLAGRRSNGG